MSGLSLLRGLVARHRACPGCGCEDVRSSRRRLGGVAERLGFKALRCRRCRMWFVLRRPIAEQRLARITPPASARTASGLATLDAEIERRLTAGLDQEPEPAGVAAGSSPRPAAGRARPRTTGKSR